MHSHNQSKKRLRSSVYSTTNKNVLTTLNNICHFAIRPILRTFLTSFIRSVYGESSELFLTHHRNLLLLMYYNRTFSLDIKILSKISILIPNYRIWKRVCKNFQYLIFGKYWNVFKYPYWTTSYIFTIDRSQTPNKYHCHVIT